MGQIRSVVIYRPTLRVFQNPGAREYIVDEARERVKADNVWCVGNKVRERVHVIVIHLAVAVVDQVLDSANVDMRGAHDAADVLDDRAGRSCSFNAETELGDGINGAGFG